MPSQGADKTQHALADALSGIGGLAALTLGGLYLAGIVTTTAELHHAGIPVADALKLLPLEDVLRSGLTIVVPALVTLMILGLVLLGCWRYERLLSKHTRRFREHESPHQSLLSRAQWTTELEEAERRTAWDRIRPEVDKALAAARTAGDKKREEPLWAFVKALRWWTVIAVVIGFLLIPGFCLFLPEPFALGTFAAVLIAAVVFAKRPRPIQQELGVWYGLMLVGLIAGTLAYPRPLAAAHLVTDNEDRVSGQLVLVTDTVWYVGTGRNVIRAVSNDHIQCAQIVGQTRRVRVIDQLIYPTGRGEADAPPLTCKRTVTSKAKKTVAKPRKRATTK